MELPRIKTKNVDWYLDLSVIKGVDQDMESTDNLSIQNNKMYIVEEMIDEYTRTNKPSVLIFKGLEEKIDTTIIIKSASVRDMIQNFTFSSEEETLNNFRKLYEYCVRTKLYICDDNRTKEILSNVFENIPNMLYLSGSVFYGADTLLSVAEIVGEINKPQKDYIEDIKNFSPGTSPNLAEYESDQKKDFKDKIEVINQSISQDISKKTDENKKMLKSLFNNFGFNKAATLSVGLISCGGILYYFMNKNAVFINPETIIDNIFTTNNYKELNTVKQKISLVHGFIGGTCTSLAIKFLFKIFK